MKAARILIASILFMYGLFMANKESIFSGMLVILLGSLLIPMPENIKGKYGKFLLIFAIAAAIFTPIYIVAENHILNAINYITGSNVRYCNYNEKCDYGRDILKPRLCKQHTPKKPLKPLYFYGEPCSECGADHVRHYEDW